jgi:hypothetical protein
MNRFRAAPFRAIAANALGSPPITAERQAAAVKNTPTLGRNKGELKLVSIHAANGSKNVIIQAATRARFPGEGDKPFFSPLLQRFDRGN